jgi:hypothetical protein
MGDEDGEDDDVEEVTETGSLIKSGGGRELVLFVGGLAACSEQAESSKHAIDIVDQNK